MQEIRKLKIFLYAPYIVLKEIGEYVKKQFI
jgi:hypothetical protein